MKKSSATPSNCDATSFNPVLKAFFGYCLNKCALRYKDMMGRALLQHKIVGPQLGIMKLLQVQGPKSQIALGQEMYIDKASMVKFIDGLEKLKYVRRVPGAEDRRIKVIELTPKGLKDLNAIAKTQRMVEDEFLSPLSKKDKDLLKEILPKLLT
ncbi:MarR family winged helix-turn-helix transcriptional regulator [Bdellovibrio bacteriovorus]|uniref:MarR family winged helix-turn-helix transcriptional regulator n=1 Tax=Bdellovibrio bacteriovorus TaxID=959 RepID=UPI003AA97AC7